MSTFTLFPSAYLSGMDATFYGETPYTTTPDTIRQYLADANDNTFALRSSPPGYIVTQQVTFELPNPTIPADEFIARIEGFVRWSEGGSGGFVGAAPYLGATPPSSIPYVTTDGRSPATPLTSTPFVQNVAWSTVDADNCNLLWLEGSQEDLSLVRTHQVGARLKTIKRSTCTVVDKTTTIDATPVISVPVTSTLDWEAAEPVNSALRKVDVEMRIELGGTVPESGTLIATATDTFQLAGTGTTTRLLTATEPIPNGTYKVYARATRNRATGTALADQVGVWSAAGTLTVNVPLPATPTVSVIEDEYGDSVSVFVTPIATTNYADPTVEVQRSDDAGISWAAVRGASSVPASFGQETVVTDVEPSRAGDLRRNLAPNPCIGGTLAWLAGGRATISDEGTFVRATITDPLASSLAQLITTQTSAAEVFAVVSPGDVVTLQAQARASAHPQMALALQFWDATRNFITGTQTAGVIASVNPTSFTQLPPLTVTAPPGAAYARWLVGLAGVTPRAIGDTFDVRRVMIEKAGSALPYLDGTTPPPGYTFSAWTGAPGSTPSYAAPRTPPMYRARVVALFNGEARNASAWSSIVPIGLAPEGWNLKAVEVPGLAFIEVPVIGEIIQEIEEDVGVFRPLDRRLPVVVAGELTGYDGSLEVRLTEQWQWETLKSLIEAQRVLLMQRPYGDQQYIRFVDKRSIGLWGTPTNPQRRVILKYVETGAP